MIVYNNPKLLGSKVIHFILFCIMPSSTQLSEYEKRQIIAYRKYGMSGYARKINRSKTVIYKFLKNPKEYDKKKHTGRSPIHTMYQKRAI